jgi:hypothetical protein
LTEDTGDLLVVGVYFNAATVTIAVSDTVGNAWSSTPAYAQVSPCAYMGGGANAAQLFYAPNVLGGSNVVTITQSSGTDPFGAFLVEYGGARTSEAFDVSTGYYPSSSTATMTTGSLTTTGSNDVVVALFASATTAGTITAGPGFTSVATDVTYFSMMEDDLPGMSPGTVDPSATAPNGAPSNCWVGAAASFKAY